MTVLVTIKGIIILLWCESCWHDHYSILLANKAVFDARALFSRSLNASLSSIAAGIYEILVTFVTHHLSRQFSRFKLQHML